MRYLVPEEQVGHDPRPGSQISDRSVHVVDIFIQIGKRYKYFEKQLTRALSQDAVAEPAIAKLAPFSDLKVDERTKNTWMTIRRHDSTFG